MPLAVLVSGGGSNLQSILDKIDAGSLDAEVRLVVSNKPETLRP
jgi:phosphoribosylglycinamide formyltransferase-1